MPYGIDEFVMFKFIQRNFNDLIKLKLINLMIILNTRLDFFKLKTYFYIYYFEMISQMYLL